MEKTIKEVTRRCPYCYGDMKIKKGLTSENVKRLFRKPTFNDFIILFILLMTIVSFLIYTVEVKAYQEYIAKNCPIGQQEGDNLNEVNIPGLLSSGLNKTNNNSYG